jgi:hypothetical protein
MFSLWIVVLIPNICNNCSFPLVISLETSALVFCIQNILERIAMEYAVFPDEFSTKV